MTLAFPLALVAFLALPALWWLLRERARPAPLVVPSLAPWKQIAGAHPMAAARWTRRWSLIVALHLVGAAAIVVAMGGPIGVSAGPAPRLSVIVIDGSGRMNARRAEGVPRWQRVRDLVPSTAADARAVDESMFFDADPMRTPSASGISPSDYLVRTVPPRWPPLDSALDLRPWVVAARTAVAAARSSARVLVFTDRIPAGMGPLPNETWVLVGDETPNAGITDIRLAAIDGARTDLAVTVTNGSGPAREDLLEIRDSAGKKIASRGVAVAVGGETTLVFREVTLGPATSIVLLSRDGQSLNDALETDDSATLSEWPDPKVVVAVVGDPDPDLDRALRSVGGLDTRRVAPAAIPPEAGLIVAVGEAVPVRSGLPCVWIAPRGAVGPFRPGAMREKPAITDVRTGAVEFTGVDVRAIQWRRMRHYDIDPSAAGATRVLASTDAGPLLVRWDASDGAPRYLCAVETAWQGGEGATDWSRLPAFPVFWAAVVEQALGGRIASGRGKALVAARVGKPVLLRGLDPNLDDEALTKLAASKEGGGRICSVRRLGAVFEVTAWNRGPLTIPGQPHIWFNVLDPEVTRTASPSVPPPSFAWDPAPTPAAGAEPDRPSLSPFFLLPAFLALFAAWFFESAQ